MFIVLFQSSALLEHFSTVSTLSCGPKENEIGLPNYSGENEVFLCDRWSPSAETLSVFWELIIHWISYSYGEWETWLIKGPSKANAD